MVNRQFALAVVENLSLQGGDTFEDTTYVMAMHHGIKEMKLVTRQFIPSCESIFLNLIHVMNVGTKDQLTMH